MRSPCRVITDRSQALTAILKPSYAPIEQYAEVPSMKQGPWTDVYALAAVLYCAITGRTPPPSVARMVKDGLRITEFHREQRNLEDAFIDILGRLDAGQPAVTPPPMPQQDEIPTLPAQ